MSVEWLISKDDGTPATLETLGVTVCTVTLAANGEDYLSFTVDEDWTANPAFPNKSKVALIRRDGAIDKCVFVGWVRQIPRDASAEAEALSYTAEGPSAALRRIDYAQAWTVITEDDGEPSPVLEPRVILGMNASGARRSTGQQIGDVITYAINKGLPIAKGTIANGLNAPRDEQENIKCMDAILTMLRWTPTHVLWWDYNNIEGGVWTPKANVTPATEMTAIDAALHNGDVATASFTPRYDLVVPGVAVTYRIAGEKDGKAYERRQYDLAGDTADAESMSFYIDLQGANYQTMQQDVETGDYPYGGTYAEAKTWFKTLVPWLAALPNGDWSITSFKRSGTKHLPRYLVSGSVCEWMTLLTERETITAIAQIITRDKDGEITEDTEREIPIKLVSTDATTRSYKKRLLTGDSEAVPIGLADAILAEWSMLEWDGAFLLDEEEPTFTIIPGRVVNWTGARAEWATMRAVVQTVSVDIMSGGINVATGPCARLEADSRLAMFRAVRSRRIPMSSSHDDGEVDAISGAEDTAEQDTQPAQAKARRRMTMRAKDASGRVHLIDLNPAGVSFAERPQASVQYLIPRESYVLGAGGKVRKQQIIAGEPYGEEIDPEDVPPDEPTAPPCGHPGNQPGGGAGTPDDDPSVVDNDHPGEKPGDGYDTDHPGEGEGEDGVTPESSGECQ